MNRCIQLDNDVLAMHWDEDRHGRVTLGKMWLMPVSTFLKIFSR